MPNPPTGAAPRLALSVVIPVYRSAASIRRVVNVLSTLEVDGGFEVVLVHDGSPDETLYVCRDVLAEAKFPLVLIDLAKNFGEHNAVMTGLRHARGEYVVTMDDDLQNPPGEILKLVEHARAKSFDCVYGDYRSKQHSWWRNAGSAFTNWIGRFVLEKPAGLYLSSFKCMSAFLVGEIVRYDGPFPYLDGLILQTTSRIGSVVVEHVARESGASGYTLRKLVRLWMCMFLNFSVMPLRLATMLGFGFGTLGAVMIAYVLSDYFLHGTAALGWPSLMATILVFSGAQLVILGLFGEYLGRVFLTINKRPQSVVRSVERNAPEVQAATQKTAARLT